MYYILRTGRRVMHRRESECTIIITKFVTAARRQLLHKLYATYSRY